MNDEHKDKPPAHLMCSDGTNLSRRQVQMLDLLAEGYSNSTIAEQLNISEHTVKVHIWRLFTRTGVGSRGAAVAWWMRNNPNSETAEAAYARGVADGERNFIARLQRLSVATMTTTTA